MTAKASILIVEDEAAIRRGLTDVLVYHGYDVTAVSDGVSGLSQGRDGNFDLILLDIMLPGLNGFDLCEALRRHSSHPPIIMLTARVSDEDIVHGLRLGADDYVAKPFSVQQLVLRIGAVLRRTRPGVTAPEPFELLNGVRVDPANLEAVRAAQEPVTLTRREMDVLGYLWSHRQRAVPRTELLAEVWGYADPASIETRTVEIHVAKLRRKIETDPAQPECLVTVRGAGYRLLGS